jgi:type IV fimbrial biogenesis protein FimT
MHAVSASRRQSARGFTAIEALVVVAIMGIMLAVGMPAMSNWLLGRKALSAAVFYQDGLALARNTAIARNAHTRFVLTPNATNGQMDWQVDQCYGLCDDTHGNWSTLTDVAFDDPTKLTFSGAQAKSVQRSATAMPANTVLTQTIAPAGATALYFTALGWVDTGVTPTLASIDLKPVASRATAFPERMVRVPLGGIAAICDPNAVAHATNGCPP